jgi:hypothetical protein
MEETRMFTNSSVGEVVGRMTGSIWVGTSVGTSVGTVVWIGSGVVVGSVAGTWVCPPHAVRRKMNIRIGAIRFMDDPD